MDAHLNLFVPEGTWMLLTPIEIIDRNVSITGAGYGTRFVVSAKSDGIFLNNVKGIQNDFILEKFQIYPYSTQIPGKSGIKMWKRGTIRDVNIQGFSKYGLHINAAVSVRQNCNGSKIDMVTVSNCGDSGIFIDGSDANSISFYSVSVQNNGGWGIEDSSFLGNNFFGCMAHKNKKGAYTVEHSTARSFFSGCYAEGDQPPSVFHGEVEIEGGRYASAALKAGSVIRK